MNSISAGRIMNTSLNKINHSNNKTKNCKDKLRIKTIKGDTLTSTAKTSKIWDMLFPMGHIHTIHNKKINLILMLNIKSYKIKWPNFSKKVMISKDHSLIKKAN